MNTLLLLPVLLNQLAVIESDSLTINLEPADSLRFNKVMSDAFERKHITHLTIELKANQDSWIVFGRFPGRPDIKNDPSYSINHKVGTLPDAFDKLTSLQFLKIAFLGLDYLPESIMHITTLQELDISFNKLVDPHAEFEKLKKMSVLKQLEIYGCGFSLQQIQSLQAMNPTLQIYYTEEHLTERRKNQR